MVGGAVVGGVVTVVDVVRVAVLDRMRRMVALVDMVCEHDTILGSIARD